MKEFRRAHKGQSLSSSINRPWEKSLVYSRSLSLNEDNALALGEGGSLQSWPLVLSFGFKVNLHVGLNVERHSLHCKYSHWDQWLCLQSKILLTVRKSHMIWDDRSGTKIWFYIFRWIYSYILVLGYILGFLVLACTCCVCRIVL